MKRVILQFLLIVSPLLGIHQQTHAQSYLNYEWAKSIGGSSYDYVQAVTTDVNGNVYVVGYTGGTTDFNLGGSGGSATFAGGTDAFLAKYSSNGTFLWAKSIGGSDLDFAYGVATDVNGNVYITGAFEGTAVDFNLGGTGGTLTSSGGSDAFLAKYDPSGTFLWAKSGGGTGADQGRSVSTDANGNVYITGYFAAQGAEFNSGGTGGTLASAGGSDAFIVKYDPSGTFLWAKGGGGTGADQARGVGTDANGNVYITGYFAAAGAEFNSGGVGGTLTSAGNNEMFVAKYNTSGTFLWAKSGGGTGADYGYGIAVESSGNVYVVGNFPSAGANFNPGGTGGALTSGGSVDIFVTKYNPSGNFLWAKKGGSPGLDEGAGVDVDANGNVYITGYIAAPADFNPGGTGGAIPPGQLFIAKYDPSGTFIRAKSMGGDNTVRGYGISVDANENVYIGGYKGNAAADFNPGGIGGNIPHAGSADGFVVKLNQRCQLSTTLTQSTCDSFTFNGVVYTTSGVYADSFVTSAGCDSIVLLNMTVNYSSATDSINAGTFCDSATFNGITYTSSGTYTQSYSNSNGCDSNIVYNITISHSTNSNITATACEVYKFNDTIEFTSSGTYVLNFTNQMGCDSIVTLNLTINSIPTATATATLSGTTLTANSGNGYTYQWLRCDDNFAVISGANSQSYTVTATGEYAVVVTSGSCEDTSVCVRVEPVGIDEIIAQQFSLYPNPTTNTVTIVAENGLTNANIRLINIIGQTMSEYKNKSGSSFLIDMSKFVKGIYFVEINNGIHVIRKKVIKQ